MTYKLCKLQITNFRNLENHVLTFSKSINCIFGENGNGKTNILEAINVLATKKSFRKNASFPQYLSINCGKPEIIFSAVLANNENILLSYSTKMTHESNIWYMNGDLIKKKLDIKTIFINPFDSYSFHNNASERREWLDYFISEIDAIYKQNLKKFQQALRFRNTLLLKKPPKYIEQIQSSDKEFSKLINFITKKRISFLESLENLLSETFHALFSETHKLKIVLESKAFSLDEESILKALIFNLPKDVERSVTTFGPHKDDYTLLFDGLNSFEYCSLGQQKMSYLSLLFAYIELFRYKYMSYPIVLIDDVSGELDQHRWRRLVEYLEKRQFQVFITTANEKFKEELDRIEGANKINVNHGSFH